MLRYSVEIGGRTVEVFLDSAADGAIHATVDGTPCDAEVVSAPGGIRLRVGETVLDLAVELRKEEIVLHGPGGTVFAKARSDRDEVLARSGAAAAGPSSVRSPMPGRVVSVLVAAGAKVAAGTPVAVVEAMKMENELRAYVEAGEGLVRIG